MMSLQDGVGCWAEVDPGLPRAAAAAALFLDRDGVIVEEVGYLRRAGDVRLIAGAAETIRAANVSGRSVVVVTNQSGIARGYFGWAEFEAVQAQIARLLAAEGARVDAVFACGHHPTGAGDLGGADHPWRKPNAGMLHAAAERLGLHLSRSLIVGDRATDLAAGRAAGLPLGVHVATGHGDARERAAAQALAGPGFDVRLARDIADVREMLGAGGQPA